MRVIDLNADLGEGEQGDAELLTVVTSCNIACGGHAGDAASMRTTIERALEHDVATGAHPSYPDREGFGRRSQFLKGVALRDSLLEQIVALQRIAAACGAHLSHVKPHGALYSDSCIDDELAMLVADVVQQLSTSLLLVGLPNSALQRAAASSGIGYVAEGFVDRAYRNDGQLVPRTESGAVHNDRGVMAAQAVSLAVDRSVTTLDGQILDLHVGTLCIHGDTTDAVAAARTVRVALESNEVALCAVGR